MAAVSWMLLALLIGEALTATSCSTERPEAASARVKPALEVVADAKEEAPPDSLAGPLQNEATVPGSVVAAGDGQREEEGVVIVAAAEVAAEGLPPEEPAPPPQSPEAGKPAEDFTVSNELYAKTFSEIESVVAALDSIMREQRYGDWVKLLSVEYAARTGSAQFLSEVSESTRLKHEKVVLRTLKDYFVHVVVPSRMEARLERLSFIDQEHVKALTTIQGCVVMLYYLVRQNGEWKIGDW